MLSVKLSVPMPATITVAVPGRKKTGDPVTSSVSPFSVSVTKTLVKATPFNDPDPVVEVVTVMGIARAEAAPDSSKEAVAMRLESFMVD